MWRRSDWPSALLVAVLSGCAPLLSSVAPQPVPVPKKDLLVALPVLEPGGPSNAPFVPLQPVRWDEPQPERLGPPLENNKPGANNNRQPPERLPWPLENNKPGANNNQSPERLPPPREYTKPGANNNRKGDNKAEPQPLPFPIGGRLTLLQAVQLGLQADPRLRGAAELISQAEAEVVAAATKPNPTLTVLGSQVPLFRAFKPSNQGGPPQFEVDLSYPIDWCVFDKMATAIGLAKANVAVSELEYAELLRQRIAGVVLAYYDVLEAQYLERVARQDRETLSRTERVVDDAVRAGTKARVDLQRVRLDRLRSEQAVREAESNLCLARAKLHGLLGRTDAVPPFEVEGDLDAPLPGGDISTDMLFAHAAETRPDVRSAHAAVARAQAEVEAEDAKGYPEMSIKGQYLHQFQRTTIGFPDADSWGAGLDITLPCYNRNEGPRLKARSKLAQQKHYLQAALVELRTEIERTAQEYRTARGSADAIGNDQLRLADSIRDTIDSAYQAGNRSLLELLEAQRSYRETYRLHLVTRANFYRAAYRLQNATGMKVGP